ncbi:unnamed protein product [Prorocentrum cordatum]|uniref:Uncharacterized protein n=1 Tax=Prorocentrum cordatum TaxID=2364126 RepID=A0ABN9WCV2_9DINO|nr:unnamed protein product [Polarella glacialis]
MGSVSFEFPSPHPHLPGEGALGALTYPVPVGVEMALAMETDRVDCLRSRLGRLGRERRAERLALHTRAASPILHPKHPPMKLGACAKSAEAKAPLALDRPLNLPPPMARRFWCAGDQAFARRCRARPRTRHTTEGCPRSPRSVPPLVTESIPPAQGERRCTIERMTLDDCDLLVVGNRPGDVAASAIKSPASQASAQGQHREKENGGRARRGAQKEARKP